MATPHVAGFVAYLLTLDSSLTPSSVSLTIKSQSLKDILSGIRKFTNPPINITPNQLLLSVAAGTPNALINNGV